MPTVARFNLTPVKSTALHHPERIELSERGAVGDRLFMFVDADGKRLSGAAKAPLLGIRCQHDERAGRLRVTMPDGTIAEGDATPCGERMRVALFDRETLVRPLGEPFAEAISGHLGHPAMLARVEPTEWSRGSHPVSIVSLASVEELGRRASAGEAPDPRRFRMLVELGGCEPHEEDAWSGRRVQLGDAIVRVGALVPRCVVTTLDPDTGRPDFPTLDVLATYRLKDRQLVFGVYAGIERTGTVRVGDPVSVLDD
jgi:uncharacterized protein YcbX